MEVKQILKALRENNIDISLNGNNIQIHSENPEIPSHLLDNLKKNKQNIIDYLRNSASSEVDYQSIPNIDHQPSYLLSSAQKRLWVMSQFEEGNVAYNIPGIYVFEGDLQKDILEHSFKTLIERHEILRTVFKEDDMGEIKQWIKKTEDTDFKIEYSDFRHLSDYEQKIQPILQSQIESPFDLINGLLLRAHLIQIADKKFIFSYTMHHIISDSWSMGVMIRELMLLYNSYSKKLPNPLSPLRIQYKDYAAWQQNQLGNEQLDSHKSYWLNMFSGEIPVLEMATDRLRPAIKTYNGGNLSKTIDKDLVTKFKNLNKKNGTTLFMGLLAAVNALLYRYTNQEDIVIGSPIAGREHVDLEE